MKDMETQKMANGQSRQDCSSGNLIREIDEPASIERQIEALLATEEDVTVLHNRLFSQTGLFHQLAAMGDARQKQKDSPLYRRAKAAVNKMMFDIEADIRKCICEATQGRQIQG